MGLTGKEFHLKLERKPGRLIKTHHTHLKIVRADAPAFKQRGLLHSPFNQLVADPQLDVDLADHSMIPES